MAKNSQIHFYLSTELRNTLKKEADENKITVSELCRRKLLECSRLTRIETLLERLEKKLLERKL